MKNFISEPSFEALDRWAYRILAPTEDYTGLWVAFSDPVIFRLQVGP